MPLGFGQVHTIDISKKRTGDGRDSLDDLVAAVAAKAGAKPKAPSPRSRFAFPVPRLGVAAALGAVVLVGAVGIYLFSGAAASDPFKGGTVAVHQFEALTEDRESRLAARLASESIERIFATNFINTIAAWEAPEKALASADFGLRGTVDRDGDEMRVTVDVADTRSGRTLWSTQSSRATSEVRDLGEQLAVVVADVLRCATYTKRRIPKYDSAELFSRILRYCEAERSGGSQFQQLIKLSQSLREVAPKNAQAQAYYANALVLAHEDAAAADLPPIYAAIKKALALDPNNGAIRWAMAKIADPSISLAERERLAREGLRLDPDYLWNRNFLANIMLKVGRIEEGAQLYQEFVADYPLDYNQRGVYAFLLAEEGFRDSSREQFRLIRERRNGLTGWADNYEWRADLFYGAPARAQAAFIPAMYPPSYSKCVKFAIDARERRSNPSAAAVQSACADAPGPEATFQAYFGNLDEAIEDLDRDIELLAPPGQFGPHWVFERGFEKLRQDPRLIGILAKAGIPQYWLETGHFADYCSREKLPYDCRAEARKAVAALKS